MNIKDTYSEIEMNTYTAQDLAELCVKPVKEAAVVIGDIQMGDISVEQFAAWLMGTYKIVS